MEKSEKKTIYRYHIYVGLSHKDTKEQRFEIDRYISLVDYISKNNGISYTLSTCRGGYSFESGAYVNENSLDIMLLGAETGIVEELASELCAMLGQECVMITRDTTEMYYLSESLM